MSYAALAAQIDALWERRASLSPATSGEDRAAITEALALLDSGAVRVAEPTPSGWVVHQWLKKAVLLSFRIHDAAPMPGAGGAPVFDKVPMKFAGWDAERFAAAGIRVVPGAVVRHSAYIAPGAVLMPCFVNVGAYVGSGTMVDTWATVGSCAQVGRNCHISGGVGIGGGLEVAEGVIVERGSVLAMGVFLGASTRIVDRASGEVFTGRVPAYSVVVPGTLPARPLPDGSPGPALACAVIVKRVDARTREKTSINELLRD